jgi:AcrR family transcriptional regulator
LSGFSQWVKHRLLLFQQADKMWFRYSGPESSLRYTRLAQLQSLNKRYAFAFACLDHKRSTCALFQLDLLLNIRYNMDTVRTFVHKVGVMQPEILSRGEQTRSAIIQVAHDLFLQQGYHGTSMRQIANHANIALSSLYNHFSSKEEIFRAVFIQFNPYGTVLPSLLQAQGQTIEELVSDSARRLLASLKEHPDFLNLMFIEIVEFKNVHVSELFNRIYPNALQVIERIAAIEPQRLRPIPPLILMRTFLGLFFSYYISEVILAQNAPPEFSTHAMEHLTDIFLHGILLPTPGDHQAGT